MSDLTNQPQQPMGSSFFGAINPPLQALSKFGTALGAGFAQDPRQRELYQLQQQQEAEQEQESIRQGIEMWMSALDDLRVQAEQPGSDVLFNAPQMQKTIQSLRNIAGEYAQLGGVDPRILEARLDQIVSFGLTPKSSTEGTTFEQNLGTLRGEGIEVSPEQMLEGAGFRVADAALPAIQEKLNAFKIAFGREPNEQEKLQMFGAAQPAGTNVNVNVSNNTASNGVVYPEPEPGMDYMRDQNGVPQLFKDASTGAYTPVLVPIPGGKPAKEAEGAAAALAGREAQQEQVADVVTTETDRAIALATQDTALNTAMGRALLKDIPGTAAKNLAQLIETIKSNVGFDKLQVMRDNSKTGAALGPVSDFENRQLQATLGSLDVAQGADQLIYNLKRVKNMYLDIIHGAGGGPPREKLESAPSSAEGQAEGLYEGAEVIQNGNRFKIINGEPVFQGKAE